MLKQKPKNKQKLDYEQIGKMVANIYETGYIDRNQMYKMSFLKGLISGLGGAVGATLLIALIIWLLSLFSNVPVIGRFVNNVKSTVQTEPK